MATLGLLEMLNAAIGTPHLGVVDLVALHKLLEAIIGQLGQQEPSVLEPGQSPTPSLATDQDSKDQPGQEKEEDGALGTGQQLWKPEEQLEGTGSNSEVSSMAKELMPKTTEEEERAVSKKRASLQDLWEEINKFKEVQSGLAEDMWEMQEAHSGLEQDMRAMQQAMQEAHSGLAEDIQEIQETLGLLDRRELGAFRQQQEERWKSLRGQLREKALQPERDSAAGMRKQLLPGFHCLSCDRPLNMLAPGPERTGECRFPTVARSCGGPHTLTPPRFQPQPPSTPRPSQPSARSPNKKDAMQLSGQDGTGGNRQDEQLSRMGGSELPTTPRATPETSTSRSRPSTPSPLLLAVLKHQPASSPGRFTLAPKLLPPIQPRRSEPTP